MIAFSTLERGYKRLARRKVLCCFGTAAFVLMIRAVLLPIWPIPAPGIYDEFSYQLQADTFAHARLANPVHPMWQFFETLFVIQQPTYASRYPPAQGLAMALGQVVFGHPWYGVWLSCGALMAAICWALQGWVPGRWALAGAAISLHLCLMTYWMNGYWGGAVPAIGGALLVGSFERIRRQGPRAWGWVAGLGVVVLMYSRPFEGGLLCLPVLAGLAFQRKSRGALPPALLVVALGLAGLAYYNFRVTGRPLQMPYQEYYDQYETVAPLSVVDALPPKFYRHAIFEWVDRGWALDLWQHSRTAGFALTRLRDWNKLTAMVFGNSLWLIPVLLCLPALLRSQKSRWLVGFASAMVAASAIEVNLFAHYAAPFLAVFVILAVVGLRHTRKWAPLVLILLVGHRAAFDTWRIFTDSTPDRFKSNNAGKSAIERDLAERDQDSGHPARHVVLVRYSKPRSPHEEWVYNPADIDSAPVVWARDMGDEENAKLKAYYPGRTFWRFDPDVSATNLVREH